MQPIDWVRWCLADHAPEVVDLMMRQIESQVRKSKAKEPLLLARANKHGGYAVGYLVICPGALGVIGQVRYEQEESGTPAEFEKGGLAEALSTQVMSELCQGAIARGAEMVQRIVPATHVWDANSVDRLDDVYDRAASRAGMRPVATLIQLERFVAEQERDTWTKGGQLGPVVAMEPYDTLPVEAWHRLVESTYQATLDVPELNGARSIGNTLEGYQSQVEGRLRSWWRVRCDDQDVGCLMLTPYDYGSCELTYLGIAPPFRGRGLSRQILQFVFRWLVDQQIYHMGLAVDERNTPALRLYEAFQFLRGDRVKAWFFVP